MPIIKSAKKRDKVAARQSIQNSKTRKSLRSSIKDFQSAITDGKKVEEAQKTAQSTIDTAVKKNVISKSRAARLNSRINEEAKKVSGGKKTTTKKIVKKTTVAKKAAPKKKPAAKKTTKK